ncbi:hypothetical protein VM1G_11667 [Cytospora mali]|uniref:Uncharacterized protein n=1 Tax=Cytospora mali TaxID=578113 RepID=A0A194W1T4_CYTMA|nr:hypothetical protein VM1G_11667 [Valsa mali]
MLVLKRPYLAFGSFPSPRARAFGLLVAGLDPSSTRNNPFTLLIKIISFPPSREGTTR